MATQTIPHRGSADWVGHRLTAMASSEKCADSEACSELLGWLYTVVRHRAWQSDASADARADVAQDAIGGVFHALAGSHAVFAGRGNPAAVLERVAARAVADAWHVYRMAGLGGVPGNGRNWRKPYPVRLEGAAAEWVLETSSPAGEPAGDDAVRAAGRVCAWVRRALGVAVTGDGADAIVYALDRLGAGVSRGSLARSGHSGLATDPALGHLGLGPGAAGVFADWLLGRHDGGRHRCGVLDAALLGASVDALTRRRLRTQAVSAGIALAPATSSASAKPPARAHRRVGGRTTRAVAPACRTKTNKSSRR